MPTAADNEQRPRVLIIEDDKRLLRALSYFLRQKGMDTEEATDGESGVAAWNAKPADVVVLDNSLPEKMGYEICREIRESGDAGQRTPVIMISAFMKVLGVDDNQEDEDLVDAFLRKPFQLEQLWSVISSMRSDEGFVRPRRPANEVSLTTADLGEDDGTDQIPEEGKCRKTPFIELLARALHNQTTGILTLRESNRVRRLYFANGFPAFARSNLITENLLRYLLRIGEIDAETYRRHLSQMQQERWRPGATLVREGAISLTRLNRSHRLLVEEIIQICINWTAASFKFKVSHVPVEQAVVYDINPFQIVDRWLDRHFTNAQLLDRTQLVVKGAVTPSVRLGGWRHLVEWAYRTDPDLEEAIQQTVPCVELLNVPEERRPVRARLLQTFLVLRALELSDPDERLKHPPEKLVRALMRPPSPDDANESSGAPLHFSSPEMPAVSRDAAEAAHEAQRADDSSGPSSPGQLEAAEPSTVTPPPDAGDAADPTERGEGETEGRTKEQLRRIYDVVLRDYRRVLERNNPYEVLRVSRNDSIEVVRRRYERFERFYRPENFQRLGDSKLYQLAIEIRQALARAVAEIEAGVSSSPAMQSINPDASFGRGISWLDAGATSDPLAQIFFNDGLTFLRLSDFDEAHSHFSRAAQLERANGMFQAYLIWTTFLRANRSPEAGAEAREKLERLVEGYPEEDSVYHFLAHLHREEGNLDRAVEYYRKAAELNPDNRSARLFLQRLSG